MSRPTRRHDSGMPGPGPPYLVWDGDCGFCGKWAGWLQQTARPDLTFVAHQDVDDLEDVGLTQHDVAAASWWIPVHGDPQGGADGIASALRSGRPVWARLAGRLLSVPGIIHAGRMAYRHIAANRDRLPAPDVAAPARA